MTSSQDTTRPPRGRTWAMTNGGPRTGRFRVPGEGAMLVELARKGVVARLSSHRNVAGTHRIRQNDETTPHPRVKSPGYMPMSRMTPKRGKQ
jgi:hypothetical protein